MRASVAGDFLKSLVLWCGGTALYVIGVWLAVAEKNIPSLSCLGFGSILLFFANLDRIEFFKGFGLEAKTRKLEAQIKDTDELLGHLKTLWMMTGEHMVDTITAGGRWDSHVGNRRVYEIVNDIEKHLISIGVNQPSIDDVTKSWNKWTAIDLALLAVNDLRNEYSRLKNSPDAAGIPASTFGNFEKLLDSMTRYPSDQLPSVIEQIFATVPVMKPDELARFRSNAKPWVDELTYLLIHGDLPSNSHFLALES